MDGLLHMEEMTTIQIKVLMTTSEFISILKILKA